MIAGRPRFNAITPDQGSERDRVARQDARSTEEQRRRWHQSRERLREARAALAAGRNDQALALFTQAHDLGDDHALCHARAHLGRARVEIALGRRHEAAVDAMFAALAALVSPLRRLRGVRGRGFGGVGPA